MRPSAVETSRTENDGRGLAIAAEAMYLLNLLAFPGIAFIILLVLWKTVGDQAPALARQHLQQASLVSLWGGVLIVLFSVLLLVLGSFHSAWTWMWVILYFTCIHSTLVVFGIIALAKAMAGQQWRYPLIGPKS